MIENRCSDKENLTTRQMVIEQGLDYLRGVGSDQICTICIANGGSCCKGCRNLSFKVGCRIRNTSCTAWLCGFLRYFLYEVDLLEEWNSFWRQVPGRDYREDYTPDYFELQKTLRKRNLRFLSNELAEDLKRLSENHPKQRYIIDLRENIDKHLDLLFDWENRPDQRTFIKSNLGTLSKEFYRFHQALKTYRSN
ncbi:hypothetical protein ACFQ88_23530 [Paenibacillus sp. NPDC056579]|uniref:hypothetical protein n=1 Tax=Paenibacillus sp. NPDC056579 TaxID=3345871 RepID=UPI0036ABBB01